MPREHCRRAEHFPGADVANHHLLPFGSGVDDLDPSVDQRVAEGRRVALGKNGRPLPDPPGVGGSNGVRESRRVQPGELPQATASAGHGGIGDRRGFAQREQRLALMEKTKQVSPGRACGPIWRNLLRKKRPDLAVRALSGVYRVRMRGRPFTRWPRAARLAGPPGWLARRSLPCGSARPARPAPWRRGRSLRRRRGCRR